MHQYLREGDINMFDDFLDQLVEFRAFSNYCQAFRIIPKLISAAKYNEFLDKVAFMVLSTMKKSRFTKFLNLNLVKDLKVLVGRYFSLNPSKFSVI